MIKNTFILLDGIGEKRERKLWKEGILTWDDFFCCSQVLDIDCERKKLYDEFLYRAQEALSYRDCLFFSQTLKRREHWRLFDQFFEDALCLDIETNGLNPEKGGYVTVVGLYSPKGYTALIKGESLSERILQDHLDNHRYLITFYGTVFDIPFLKKEFPKLQIDHIPHFDLFFAAKRLEIQGGLKKIEALFLLDRDDKLKGLNGYDAVKFWKAYLSGHSESLDMLICYNRADTENLFKLAKIFYSMLRRQAGIDEFLNNEREGTAQ